MGMDIEYTPVCDEYLLRPDFFQKTEPLILWKTVPEYCRGVGFYDNRSAWKLGRLLSNQDTGVFRDLWFSGDLPGFAFGGENFAGESGFIYNEYGPVKYTLSSRVREIALYLEQWNGDIFTNRFHEMQSLLSLREEDFPYYQENLIRFQIFYRETAAKGLGVVCEPG